MQLLIVDDEAHVVERLEKTVSWEKAGIDEVYAAHSGQEALNLLRQFSVDIVITDIRMPGMSGLDLIAEIRRHWKRTKCVLLSGYSDFEYAKEAIQHQVEEYLLKPVTEEQLLRTVSRLRQKLAEEWEQVWSVQKLTRTLQENLPLLKGNLLNELLQGGVMNEQTLREKMQALSIPDLHGRSCRLMLIRLEEPFFGYDFRSRSLIEYAIANIAEELFQPHFYLWHAKDAHEDLVFVAAPRDGENHDVNDWEFERTAAELQSVVRTFLKGHISVIVSESGEFPRHVPALYDDCLTAARKNAGGVRDQVLRAAGVPARVEVESVRSLYEPPSLMHLLEAGRWDDTKERLERIIGELEAQGNVSQEQLLEVYFFVSSAFSYIAHKNGQPLSAVIGGDYGKLAAGVPFRSIAQLRDWAVHVVDRLKEDTYREAKDYRSSLIRTIHKFIEEHLSQDVTLQTIADHVHMHPVYVSKMYKQETGINISEYIHRLRMEKAVFLLANSREKTYEIAAKLGYQRSHSFIHAFKKEYGLTPQEYREQRTKGAADARCPNGGEPSSCH